MRGVRRGHGGSCLLLRCSVVHILGAREAQCALVRHGTCAATPGHNHGLNAVIFRHLPRTWEDTSGFWLAFGDPDEALFILHRCCCCLACVPLKSRRGEVAALWAVPRARVMAWLPAQDAL